MGDDFDFEDVDNLLRRREVILRETRAQMQLALAAGKPFQLNLAVFITVEDLKMLFDEPNPLVTELKCRCLAEDVRDTAIRNFYELVSVGQEPS